MSGNSGNLFVVSALARAEWSVTTSACHGISAKTNEIIRYGMVIENRTINVYNLLERVRVGFMEMDNVMLSVYGQVIQTTKDT